MPSQPSDLLSEAIWKALEDLPEGFWGEVTVRFQHGRPVIVTVTRTIKLAAGTTAPHKEVPRGRKGTGRNPD